MAEETFRTADYLSVKALDITLTGPVKIGNPLDFRQTTIMEYKAKQDAVKERMEKLFLQYNWEIPRWGEGQTYEMGSSGTGKAHTPPFYLECTIDSKQIRCSIEKYNFLIKKIKIKFYEFGFATVSVSCSISPRFSYETSKGKIQTSDLLRIVNKFDNEIVGGQVEYIERIVSILTKNFNNTIKENKIAEFSTGGKIIDKAMDEDYNNIKSLHRIFEYKVNKTYEIKVIQKKFNKIAEISKGQWQEENLFSHFAGVANSVIIYNFNIQRAKKNIDNKILKRYSLAYKTVLERANAYYFIAEFIKNGLFDFSRETVAGKKSKSIWKRFIIFKIFIRLTNRRESDDAQTELNKFIFLASNFLSAVDEFIINLSPQGKNIWDEMDEKWNASKTTTMLQSQLQNSLSIADRVLQQTRNNRQIWLNFIATTFTAIGAISLVEIAGSSGFHWRFHIEKWDSSMSAFWNIGNIISMFTNLFGSILAIVLSLAIVIAIIVGIGWLICKAKCLLKALWRKVFNR